MIACSNIYSSVTHSIDDVVPQKKIVLRPTQNACLKRLQNRKEEVRLQNRKEEVYYYILQFSGTWE